LRQTSGLSSRALSITSGQSQCCPVLEGSRSCSVVLKGCPPQTHTEPISLHLKCKEQMRLCHSTSRQEKSRMLIPKIMPKENSLILCLSFLIYKMDLLK
jgi:hypothetical protein